MIQIQVLIEDQRVQTNSMKNSIRISKTNKTCNPEIEPTLNKLLCPNNRKNKNQNI